jgi:phenol 2-monooxygenase
VRAPYVRYPFEVTLHQGAIENIFLDAMSTRGLIVDRPTTVHDWQIIPVEEAQNGYRIEVTLRHLMNAVDTNKAQLQSSMTSSTATNADSHNSKETIIHAKYVIGCDGAHSWVRRKLGFTMDGEQTGKYSH